MTTSSKDAKPLLIYDGDCDFCQYWVDYWQALTDDRVTYEPYQAVANKYPAIAIEDFQRAIQYVAPDGKMASAAEATFLTLSHTRKKNVWLTLYRRLPGFATLAEKVYAFIARHRHFFYVMSVLLWGRHYQPPRYTLIAWIFLRLFGLIAFVAFFSFGMQASGLIGSHGILPLSNLIENAELQLGTARYHFLPMVFWWQANDSAIQIVCWAGALCSLLLTSNIMPRIWLLLIYVFYLSLCNAGQVFMSFQWDMYLLETSILALFLTVDTTLGIWLLRWLLFRFMFEGGLVKILSGDPAWQQLTTLNYYFLTEPLPTPLAWYADKLPQSFLTIGTAATLVIELGFTWLIFFPRHIRFVGAFAILCLQTVIALTGNYNFFNLLTMLLCLTLFDDAAIRKIIPKRWHHRTQRTSVPTPLNYFASHALAIFLISVSVMQFFIAFRNEPPSPLLTVTNAIAPFRLVNMYGPFAIITTTRMEIVIEGSADGVIWKEYAFRYKPGDLSQAPRWNTPLQPRLDWQMWFAALGSAEQNPWFTQFLSRLLENSPAVVGLLKQNPFPDKPPRYIRAEFYEYHFTTAEEQRTTGQWWTRDLMGVYFPMAHL